MFFRLHSTVSLLLAITATALQAPLWKIETQDLLRAKNNLHYNTNQLYLFPMAMNANNFSFDVIF